MSRILVADDEAGIRGVISDALERDGHEVIAAADGEEALTKFLRETPDLVITDLSMPRRDGASLVAQIRRGSLIPILVLTVRTEERQKVLLLDAGADDYVVKPFGVAELLARVRALLRRRLADDPHPAPVTIGALTADLENRRVTRGGREVHLSPIEFELLKTFLSKPGAVWTHRQLISAVWGGGAGVTNDTVRVHVGSLRRKIEKDPNRPRLLTTEPWVGYRFVVPERDET